MMKRMRPSDVPKFRRTVKNRSRIGDSVYFGTGGLLYFKLFVMWMTCVALDFVVGFRFELLYPLFLMARHLYDAFRVQTFVSSFHYSAFSVFFVCITATSDLICYLFIPVQVLVFVASTYVWIHFVYQSTERGFSAPAVFLWSLFVGFEYLVRSRFGSSPLYLTRGSWITAGLFPTNTESVFVGSAEASSRFDFYKPFAAHCLGYPIVTLGFRIKSFFSSWRLTRRRQEVMKQNDVYYRLLCDALPAPYDSRMISSSKQLALENEYELEEEAQSECGSQNGVITAQPTFSYGQNANPVAANGTHKKSRPVAAKLATSMSKIATANSQNGFCSSKRNGRAASNRPNGEAETGTERFERRSSTVSLLNLPGYILWMGRLSALLFYELVIVPIWRSFPRMGVSKKRLSTTTTPRALTNGVVKAQRPTQSDEISICEEGANDEESDHEDSGGGGQNGTAKPTETAPLISKRRTNKRARGRTPAIEPLQSSPTSTPKSSANRSEKGDDAENEDPAAEETKRNGTALKLNGLHRVEEHQKANGRTVEKAESQRNRTDAETSKLRTERDDARQQTKNLEREKEIMESALDSLRVEMRQLRGNETAVRAELSLLQNHERAQRTELQQLKAKLTDAEQRVETASRQKQSQQKRDRGSRREEQRTPTAEVDGLKGRVATLERELHSTQTELKTKQQECLKLEQMLRSATEAKGEVADIGVYHHQIAELQSEIAAMKATLKAENRLKVELFRALSESKAQVETLTVKLRELDYQSALPSSLVASLATNGGCYSQHSSPSTLSPTSSSPHSVIGSSPKNGMPSMSDDLEQFIHINGQLGYFGHDSFASTATPSTNAAAQALANQLKMAAATTQKPPSRCTSPSSHELFSIMNGNSATSLAYYGLNSAPSSAIPSSGANGSLSPSFH